MGSKIGHPYTVRIWDERDQNTVELVLETFDLGEAEGCFRRVAARERLPVTLQHGARVIRSKPLGSAPPADAHTPGR